MTTDHLEKIGNNWQFWTIEPFDENRVVAYISKWYMNTPLLTDINRDFDSNTLATAWLKDPMIGPLTGNPLLLSTLLMVHHLDGKLPNGRANLYKRYVDGMLGVWDDRHKLAATDISLNPYEKRKIIRGIALFLFLTEQEIIDENKLIVWLNDFLPRNDIKASPEDVLSVLRERTGLIVGPGIYSFAHKTIAEYLVAETVLQGDQKDNFGKRIDRFCLLEHRKNDRWNVVIFLWAGIAPSIDVISFIEQGLRDGHEALVYGILLDQYERIPIENRREMMLSLKSMRGFKKTSVYWGVPGWPSDQKAEYVVLDGHLRSISGDGFGHTLQSLCRMLVIDNTLSWSDVDKKIVDIGWVWFLMFSINQNRDFGNVLGDYPKWIGSKIVKNSLDKGILKNTQEHYRDESVLSWNMTEYDYGLLVSGRIFSWWNYKRDFNLVDLYNIYIKHFPSHVGFVSFTIFSSIVEWIEARIEGNATLLDVTYLDQSLEILLLEDVRKIDRKYLLGTRKWKFWSRMFRRGNTELTENETDLFVELKRCVTQVLSADSLNALKQIETLEKVIVVADKLMYYRDSIS